MLTLAAVREFVVRGTGDGVGVQSLCEVLWLDDDARLGVELQFDLDLVADRDTCGLPVGIAETEQVAAAQEG
ncbi:hypothetical protein [Microbispora hainanensis]|uniref:hypothetical protein n=1 Tax=Microbispora hainanensis TaxID=568844 RepID=UPI00324B91E3